MKIRTLTADTVSELDDKLSEWLSSGWELLGDMQVYKEVRQHAVHGYDIEDNKFAQRVKK